LLLAGLSRPGVQGGRAPLAKQAKKISTFFFHFGKIFFACFFNFTSFNVFRRPLSLGFPGVFDPKDEFFVVKDEFFVVKDEQY